MKAQFAPIIKKAYEIFDGINFSECNGCSICCYFPWLLEEEYNVHLKNFGKTIKKINSIAFVMDFTACKYAKKNRCNLYGTRPLDCRLFPLDLVEEDGKYYWCIFTICPKHLAIRKKLNHLIPKLEKVITSKILKQYKKQISLTKEIYPPYRLRQYEKIREFRNNS